MKLTKVNFDWREFIHTAMMDSTASGTSSLRYGNLVSDYTDVCNKALSQNSDRFPYEQILGAAKKLAHGQVVEVNVMDWGYAESYIFTLSEQGIVSQPHDACGACECVRSWDVSKDYLERVSEMPNDYIENPAKINWDWLFD